MDENVNELNLSCHEEDEKLGIWMKWDKYQLLINPISLFNTVFSDSSWLVVNTFAEGGRIKDTQSDIEVFKERGMYRWTMYSQNHSMYNYYCDIDSYARTLKSVIADFARRWTDNVLIAYGIYELKHEAVDACAGQLDVPGTFPSSCHLHADEVSIERFVFKPEKREKYTIGFGDRTYSTFFTQWDTDMEYVRHQLEEYAYGQEAHLRLSFDLSYTGIILEGIDLMDTITKYEDGTSYTYRKFVRVTVISNEFAKMPALVGYCEVGQAVAELYEGLLGLALMQPGENEMDESDDISNIVAYNQMKSPIIESALKNGWERNHSKIETRQTVIKDVLTIRPNVSGFIYHIDGSLTSYEDIDELMVPQCRIGGLKEWAEDVEPIVIKSGTGESYSKDMDDYYARGLEFAKKLREVLPPEYDLWYRSLYEDDSGITDKPCLII